MIQLLFLVLFAEGVLAFLLLVKIGPLRELVIKSLDQLKTGKGPATVKTIAGTMSVILLSSLMSIVKIRFYGGPICLRLHSWECLLFFPSVISCLFISCLYVFYIS
ncbi:hypothetical protein ACB092_02G141400 [Castanea dentata]